MPQNIMGYYNSPRLVPLGLLDLQVKVGAELDKQTGTDSNCNSNKDSRIEMWHQIPMFVYKRMNNSNLGC